MLAPSTNHSQRWQQRADEFRALAESVKGDDAKVTFLRIAEHYVGLAAKAGPVVAAGNDSPPPSSELSASELPDSEASGSDAPSIEVPRLEASNVESLSAEVTSTEVPGSEAPVSEPPVEPAEPNVLPWTVS